MIPNNTIELANLARADLELLSYPSARWIKGRTCGEGPVHAAIIVGGGQSGLVVAAALKRQGVDDVLVLDRSKKGSEGVWETFARMTQLRTPKGLNGMDFGCPNLSVQRWFAAQYGQAAWDTMDRIPRSDWMAYLRWYRETLNIAVANETEAVDIRAAQGVIAVETLKGERRELLFAQTVILATGYDGAGQWAVPEFVRSALPASRFDHTNGPIDFERLRGKKIAILGHAASAFDNANIALKNGAKHVDLCFRRQKLPRVNPHRFLETAGTMTHFFELPDPVKWQVACYFEAVDQPPPMAAFEAVIDDPRLTLHPGSPWLAARLDGDEIALRTPKGTLCADHLLLGTGSVIDLESRPELKTLAKVILRWRDRSASAQGERRATLGALPYLSSHYAFMPNHEDNDWVGRIFCFNFGSVISHGPHSTSISGHRHCVPRLVRGVTSALFADQADDFVDGLKTFSEPELLIPEDFEDTLTHPEYSF
jgi:cation diffusion facilitator CzcD-associated flavoprotein CzcO